MDTIEFEKLDEDAIVPYRAHEWDAGFDLFAIEKATLNVNSVEQVRTGIATAIPQGNVGLLMIRSSLGKRGIQLANAPGVVDAGYRGEIMLLMTVYNSHVNGFEIEKGQKIAQLVVVPLPNLKAELVENLSESDGRDTGGFGSTGN